MSAKSSKMNRLILTGPIRDLLRIGASVLLSVVGGSLLLLLDACMPNIAEIQAKYKVALANGMQDIPIIRQFHELYPESSCSFTYFTATDGMTALYCHVALFDKYEFTVQVNNIRFDLSHTRIVQFGMASFSLSETSAVEALPNGATRISNSHDWHFGEADWGQLYAARGEFAVLGIDLDKTHPVPGFREYWDDIQEREIIP